MSTKITFTNSWGDDITKILDRYRYYTPSHDNVWDNIIATSDMNEADYLVVLQGYPKISIKPLIKNQYTGRQVSNIVLSKYKKHPQKIFLQREPIDIEENNFESSQFIFNGVYEKHYHVATWMIKVPFNQLEQLPIPEINKPISAVVSGKQRTKAHQKRIEIIKRFSQVDNGIEIFGKNLDYLELGNCYQGPLTYNDFCKLKGLYGYKYSLAFENASHKNYFTEKITDCFLSWTKPIYWGCPNIGEYFPAGSYGYVDIFGENPIEQIKEELSKPVDYDALKQARDLVLYKYNIYPSLMNIINGL